MSAGAVNEPAPQGAGDEAAPTDALGRQAQALRLRFDVLLSHLGAVWLTSIILVILAGLFRVMRSMRPSVGPKRRPCGSSPT